MLINLGTQSARLWSGPHGQVFVRGVIERLTWDSTKLDQNKFSRSET